MGYTFKKQDRYKGRYDSLTITVGESITKAETPSDLVLRMLREFLDKEEPRLVYFLLNRWRTQERAITYKEIREAILSGAISTEYIQRWQKEYALFVVQHLKPAWDKAMQAAVEDLASKFPEWRFDPMGRGVQEWTAARTADFVTNVTQTQIEGLRAVINQAMNLEHITVDQLSRAIRPMVGLTHQQSAANLRYFNNLIDTGVSEKRALDLSIRYSARQHRYRAYNIARTELAFAYNQGSYEGTKQAQEAGYLGEMVKVWCTADDERVCKVCGGLEGKRIAMDEDFDFSTKLATPANPTIRRVPPAHPSCRCTVLYESVER